MSISVKYPTVGEYTEALCNPQGRFRSLKGCRPVYGADGEPLFHTGRGRVSFRIEYEKRLWEMTCFTRPVPALEMERYGELRRNELLAFPAGLSQGNFYPVALRPLETGGVESAPRIVLTDAHGELCEGLRWFARDGLCGYMDESGRVVIEPRWSRAEDFSEGRAAVTTPDGMMGLIDREGKLVIPPLYDDLSWDGSRFAYVDIEGKWGCLDREGNIVVTPEYDWMGEFSEGYAVAGREGRYGYVDETGNLYGEGVIYTDASSVSPEGTAEATLEGRESVLLRFEKRG